MNERAKSAKLHALFVEIKKEVILLNRKIFVLKDMVFQTLFTKNGKLTSQKTLYRYLQVSNASKQTTLDFWCAENGKDSQNQKSFRIHNGPHKSEQQNQKYLRKFLGEWDDTIGCIELDMKHDKNGNVKGWMEGESKADECDGSTDNRIKTLEEHVSKIGWLF